MSEKYPNLQKTEIAWDPYMEYLVSEIINAKYMSRAQDKPMMTPRSGEEAHITSRLMHEIQAALKSLEISKAFGLNYYLTAIAMLLHDAGHPFSAHEGEVIFTALNDIVNGQYFHHNSIGLNVIRYEQILENAIQMVRIQKGGLTPELEKQLREEFNHVLDIVISHDGEASKDDLKVKAVEYDSISEAVEDKSFKANAENNYKFIAQTPEGQVGKYSDAIAYIATDLQDAFRLDLLTEFDDEYLEIIGTIILKNRAYGLKDDQGIEANYTSEEAIQAAKDMINKLKTDKLRETAALSRTEENDPLITLAWNTANYIENLKNERKEVRDNAINSNIAEKEHSEGRLLDEYEKKKIKQQYIKDHPLVSDKEILKIINMAWRRNEGKFTNEDLVDTEEGKNYLETKYNKYYEFTAKFLEIRSDVVQCITKQIQYYFTNDLIYHSQPDKNGNGNMPAFSQQGLDLLIALKKKGMKEFVIDTKWDYQQREYPPAILKLVKKLTVNLIKAGTIRNKFYDPDVRNSMTTNRKKKKDNNEPEEVPLLTKDELRHMKAHYSSDKKRETANKYKYDIKLRAVEKGAGETNTDKAKATEQSVTKGLIEHIEKETDSFTIKYKHTYKAVEKRIKDKVERALGESNAIKPNPFYDAIIKNQLSLIRKNFIHKFNIEVTDDMRADKATYNATLRTIYSELTPEQKEEFINDLIEQDRQNMEYKMAFQYASNYIAGVTDGYIQSMLINMGYIKEEAIKDAERGNIPSESVKGHVERL